MAVGILEIHPSASVVLIKREWMLFLGVSPVLYSSIADASKDLVKVIINKKKGVVLRGNIILSFEEIE